MRFRRTYSPLPAWPPAVLAAAILTAAYVIGPALARVLTTIDTNLFEFPDQGDTP